jgi:hypothetical protein
MEQFGLVTIGLTGSTPVMVHKDALLMNVNEMKYPQKRTQNMYGPWSGFLPATTVELSSLLIIVSQLVQLTNAKEIDIFYPAPGEANAGHTRPALGTWFCDDNLNCILFTGASPSVRTKQAIELNAMYPHLIAYSRQMVNDANSPISKEQFEEMIEHRRAELEPPCPPLLSKEEFEECMSRRRGKLGGRKYKRRSNKTRKYR